MPDFGDRRVMGCSRADLERWIDELMGPGTGRFVEDRMDLRPAGVPLVIAVRDAPVRVLGLVQFRELDVSFDYATQDREAARAWIARFDRHTQRGGG
jgi:hypothetical protein